MHWHYLTGHHDINLLRACFRDWYRQTTADTGGADMTRVTLGKSRVGKPQPLICEGESRMAELLD